jgi:hypothetical protein
MKPRELIKKHGRSLIGRWVETETMGDYPGGLAVVTHINEDPVAPEIPLTVNNPFYGKIGIFDFENVKLSRKKGYMVTDETFKKDDVGSGD